MAVADVEQASFHVDGEIDGVAYAGLGRVQVAAKFGRDQRTACLTVGGSNSDTTKERVHWNLEREIRVESFERCGIGRVIYWVEPYPLLQTRFAPPPVNPTPDPPPIPGKTPH